MRRLLMNLSLLSDVELADALLKLTGDERVVTLTILHHYRAGYQEP